MKGPIIELECGEQGRHCGSRRFFWASPDPQGKEEGTQQKQVQRTTLIVIP